ncbi:MAG: hypothetical protein AAFP77_21000 [Bacteroidota bacterium]
MRLLLLSFSILFCSVLSAQDEILLVSGEAVSGQVLEVGDEIRYRKAELPDGPVYVVRRAEVAKITYANGHEEVFNDVALVEYDPADEGLPPDNSWTVQENYLGIQHYNRFYQGFRLISRAEFEDRLRTVPGAYEDFQSGRNLQVIGFIAGTGGMMISAISILANNRGSVTDRINSRLAGGSGNNRNGYGGFIAGIGVMLGGIIMVGSGNRKVLRALDAYNIQVGQNVGLRPSINANGVGLALQF